MKQKNIVVVLGMHRSGTSVITRGLQVLGVQLGTRLLPAKPDNEKGFWEDMDVNALNIELLAALGQDWHTLTPLLPEHLSPTVLDAFKLRAVQLLREKLSGVESFGLKDPRIARLLPFWTGIFAHLDVQVRYVIACRHPMSVARSLARRDGFALEKAYQLWLEHMLASLAGTQNHPRLVVDYDLLMTEPAVQLQRIAQALGLEFNTDSPAFAEYKEEFLEEGLRHSRFAVADLCLDKAASPQVKDLYDALLQMASDRVSLNAQGIEELLARLSEGLQQSYSLLNYTDQCELRIGEFASQVAIQERQITDSNIQIDALNQVIAERDGQIHALNQIIAERGEQIDGLNGVVVERDGQIHALSQVVAEKEGQIDGLSGIIAERDGQVHALNQVVAEKDGLICSLNEVGAERDGQIHALNQVIAVRGEQIDSLNETVVEREGQIHALNQVIAVREAQIDGLNGSIAERDARIHALSQVITEKEGQIGGLDEVAANRDIYIQELNRTLHERDIQIAAMQEIQHALYNSRSWRITAPLRRVNHIRRKVMDVKVIACRRLRDESFSVLLKKTLKVLRREGLNGLRVRIRHQHYLSTLAPVPTPQFSLPPVAESVAPAPTAIVRHPEGRYELAAASKGYTYIEPQRPADLEERLAALATSPLFSIVVPAYNTSPELLDAVLTSVRAQWYPHWELILVDDASPAEETRQALARIDDPKIKVLRLESNKGISGATNVGLATAQGEFIVFMDHDDELTVDCLYELALCIDRDQPDFIYSDEDKLSEEGEYTQPHFKPDWSPDTMMSTMFTCHVSCVRRALLSKVGELRSEFDGCQDWDFVLRIVEHTDRISHIPKVLYHWRIIPASVASDISAKPYVLEASRRVRLDALERRGLKGSVEPVNQVPGYFRVKYHLQGTPLISIIIPSRDNGSVLRRCLDSIQVKSSYRNFEIIILDNGSIEASTVSYLRELQGKGLARIVRHDAPFNFSELNNIGARGAKGELLLFLNDDTEVLCNDWLERMGGYAQLSHIGAVGAKLLYPDSFEIQHAGVLNLANGPVHAFLRHHSERPGYFMRNLLEYNWLAVTGACLMMESHKFNELGGFDEGLPVAYNDIELCMRAVEKGYYNLVCQAVTLTHHESVSRGLDHLDPVKFARLQGELRHLYDMHPNFFQHDPFHNPNLHPNGINFEVPV
ncbi:glycosyltransferase [Azotobacter vinelandii]|uniref:glycosyltransferase n=1 Tax=Azotobacter vinelandii TaxID=354 RepID=UPI0026669AB6|nr:glycosyltransferase [Azotobacter vinelandii]WKN23565.1 glycosyltransferase [Azotobacter vinelandii]